MEKEVGITRFLKILKLFLDNPHRMYTVKELESKFGVNERTIYRDIEKLIQEDFIKKFPSDKGSAYQLKLTNFLKSDSIKDEEIEALDFTVKFFEQTGNTEITQYLHSLEQKLEELKNNSESTDEENNHIRNYYYLNFTNDLLKLNNAIQNKTLLKITYVNENKVQSIRVIEPMGLYISTQGNWILIAFCRLQNDWRQFRLDRIQHIFVTSEKFKERDLFPDLENEEERKFTIERFFSTLSFE